MAYQWPMCRSPDGYGYMVISNHFGRMIVVVHPVDPIAFPSLLPLAVNPDRVESELNLTLGCGHKKATLNIVEAGGGGDGAQRT